MFSKKLIPALLFILYLPVNAMGQCIFQQSVCIDGPSTKMISGIPVTRDCWQYSTAYSCSTNNFTDTCDSLRQMGCGQVGSTCIDKDINGVCDVFEQTYQCQTKPATTTTTQNCSAHTFCVNNADGTQQCFDTSAGADTDFGSAVATLESMRQLGTYMDPNGTQIFKGEDNRCRIKLGIFNCCSPSGGGESFSNSAVVHAMGMVGNVAGNAADAGSGYVYDALMTSGNTWMASGIKSADSYFGGNFSFTPSVSYMGLGISYGAPAYGAGSTALWSSGTGAVEAINAANAAANTAAAAAQAAQAAQAASAAASAAAAAGTGTAAAAAEAASAAATAAEASSAAAAASSAAATTATAAAAGNPVVYFNPAMFYFAIAMLIYQELSSCTQEEQMLAMKKQQKLTHYVGSYCDMDTPLGCVQVKESYCSFNSVLARIINEQGKAQLGISWGQPESPLCTGLTIDQFQQLDFSKIDLSEFIQQIKPTIPDQSSMATTAVNNYYNQGKTTK